MPHFYAQLEPDPRLARAYVAILDTIDVYLARGLPQKAAQARRVFQELYRDFDRLGIRGAAKADELIRLRLAQTRVRPPTSGQLDRAIQSHPVPTAFPGGGVGVADMDVLDAVAVNQRTGGVYWRAQEYGLPVDPAQKPAPGYFQPGFSRPNMGEFRNHPFFEQMQYARGMPALVRTRPLPARYYLRDGSRAFAAWHTAESTRIMRRATAALARL